MSDSLQRYGLLSARLLSPWDSPGKNTGVSGHALLQGILTSRNQTCISYVSCIGRKARYHYRQLGSPIALVVGVKSSLGSKTSTKPLQYS